MPSRESKHKEGEQTADEQDSPGLSEPCVDAPHPNNEAKCVPKKQEGKPQLAEVHTEQQSHKGLLLRLLSLLPTAWLPQQPQQASTPRGH